MAERKNLIVTEVKPIQRVGDKQIPKLSFKAKDGDKEFQYFTFRTSLFEAIKKGQTINADVEVSTKEWEGQEYIDRRVVQIYVDGQPIGSQKQGYRGKSPEELELSARAYALSYAKDLCVGKIIQLVEIIPVADSYYSWLKGNKDKPASPAKTIKPSELLDESEESKPISTPTGMKVQNIAELKKLLMKHKIPTTEAYEILSIQSFQDLVDLDEAWAKIKEAKRIE